MENFKDTLKKFYSEYDKSLKLMFIGIILLIILGIAGTLNVGYEIPLFGTIIFALIMCAGILSFLYKFLKKVFHVKETTGGMKVSSIRIGSKVIVFIFAIFITLNSLLGVLLFYYYVRLPPSFQTDERLNLQTWTAVPSSGLPPGNGLDKIHKSNTKLFYFHGYFYLAYQNSKWHLQDKNGEIVIARSLDASEGSWEKMASIKGPGQNDVRDPLLTEINGRLFCYFLPNYLFDPEPNETYYCTSVDGKTWTTPEQVYISVNYDDGVKLEGNWVFGRQRPLTKDNRIWYCIAFRSIKEESPMTILISSRDGVNWREHSLIYSAHAGEEPTFEFLPNGEIRATLRVGAMSSMSGYIFGNPSGGTIIATSYNNLQDWSYAPDFQTRLDGGTMFIVNGRTFVAGRDHLGPRIDMGNHVAKKRTAIYEVKEDRLVYLFDLPSDGDTAYTGVVVKDGEVYVSYYTNPVNHDLPWIVGLAFYSATEICMAKFSASGLIEYANEVEGINV